MLQAIVYTSVSVQPMTDFMLETLLLEARRLNLESGVTGALIYSAGIFMQYFEGEPLAMAETYARIRGSRQHTRVTEMLNEPIAARAFPDWQMALAQPARSEPLALATADWVLRNSLSVAHAPVGLAMLRSFWRRRPPPD